MSKMLVILNKDDVESVNRQLVSKLEKEVDRIDVVLETENFLELPYNWNLINRDDIKDDEYIDGVYIHASREDSPLITKKVFENCFTLLFTNKIDSLSVDNKFDLTVLKDGDLVHSKAIKHEKRSNEFFIDVHNEHDVEYFMNNLGDIDKFELTINSADNNILKFSRKSSKTRSILEFIVSKDYTLVDFLDNKRNVFIKRESLSKYIPKSIKGLQVIEKNGVFYTIEEKSKNDLNAPDRLIVIFSSMPGPDEYFSAKFEERSFVKHFPTIQKLLVPNTNVLRIIDSNLMYGSHYINSNNFNNYEKTIQNIIGEVSQKLGVKGNDIVLYGTSKGGTGALVHSLIGDYKSVTVDPIVDAQEYNYNMHNIHYIKGNREQSLVKKINELSTKSTARNILIRSPQVKFNYGVTEQLNDTRIHFYDQRNSNIKSHPEIGRNSVSEILMFLNAQLLGLAI